MTMLSLYVPTAGLLGASGSEDAAALLARLLLGSFYVLARFRFVFDPSKAAGARWFNVERRESLRRKIASFGFSLDYVPTFALLLAFTEVIGGAMLVLGVGTIVAATALLGLTAVISVLTYRDKIVRQQCPIDSIDCLACYLWRVEGLYLALALMVLLIGPGRVSLDWILGVVG